MGFEIYLNKDYASHIGIKDEEYETEGANIKSNDEVLSSANAILQMNILNDESLNKLKKDQLDYKRYNDVNLHRCRDALLCCFQCVTKRQRVCLAVPLAAPIDTIVDCLKICVFKVLTF